MVNFLNIRDVLGPLIGKKIVDVTQGDWNNPAANEPIAVYIHLDDGTTLQFFTDGDRGFYYDGLDL